MLCCLSGIATDSHHLWRARRFGIHGTGAPPTWPAHGPSRMPIDSTVFPGPTKWRLHHTHSIISRNTREARVEVVIIFPTPTPCRGCDQDAHACTCTSNFFSRLPTAHSPQPSHSPQLAVRGQTEWSSCALDVHTRLAWMLRNARGDPFRLRCSGCRATMAGRRHTHTHKRKI
ncbi:uncharacterized protein K460DRAFT_100151 [Cucurbitaria berberidis CBS 394.84]|uniref:Uncharacterized protein n=1 Tax=Cucurbitaria berberidis CBS 394.84 TaxID=1168544 RepID=A0A9P4GF41_9PLEO|nr:uncharacterized protein K460DRAFT_100151 [Cucurbitaria berberidis CBS 394.84]KAF1844888.1 hypothetical protein K460DRAFT_100151 [Cucurbitaria berberidis CBS 394.84]